MQGIEINTEKNKTDHMWYDCLHIEPERMTKKVLKKQKLKQGYKIQGHYMKINCFPIYQQ